MGRVFKFSLMAVVYAFLYTPIIILIVNSFNASKFG
ncbi:spermidine/putrescine ABC transporter permease PotC, partial [Photobacterium sp. OFAV2-7]|nr:spermidine/putrescine ABC transporter permease PotC [Photobacterium sp. OFAV2-7]